jgi:hypothetical protein
VVILPTISEAEVTYSGDLLGVYSDPVNLEATLIDLLTGLPIPDKLLVFTLGTQTVSAMTNSEGVALTTLILIQPAGVYDLTVSFEGDDTYLATSVSHEFVIMKELALSHYSGLTIIEDSDSTLTLMATVLDDNDGYLGDLSNIFVTFTIYHSSDPAAPLDAIGPIVVVPTDTAGIGIASVEIPNLPSGEYLVVVSLIPEHNLHYEGPDSQTATLTVYEPNRRKTMGFGWTRDADGNEGFFLFYLKYSHRGSLRGFVHYSLRVDNYVYFLHSTELTGFAIDGNHAFFEAYAYIYQYNMETDETIKLEGTFRLRIDVWDIHRRCGSDIFQIRIYDERGLLVYEVGFDPEEETIWAKIMVSQHRCRCRRRHH